MSRAARHLLIVLALVTSATPLHGAPSSSRAGETRPAAEPLAAQASGPRARDFLGFEIGEELRYVLGPPESLLRGETGMWSIRLDEVYAGEKGDPEGVFALRHQWQAPQPIGDPPLRAIMRVESEGTLRVNAYGFPLAIQYQTVRHLAGMGDEAYTIEYVLDEDQRAYQKRTTMDGDRWYQTAPIRSHGTVHRDPPSGLFAFLPTAPGCMDRFVGTYQVQGAPIAQPRSAGTPASTQQAPQTVRVADNEDCEESLFANPGLLNLAMPAFWEAQGEREYVFFTPIGPVGRRRSGVSAGMAGAPPMGTGGVPAGIGPGSGGGFPPRTYDAPTTGATYNEVERLRFLERVAVRLGSRTIDAWLIEMNDHAGPIYVNDDGVVVRIDLPQRGESAERYIRRLWPSEF